MKVLINGATAGTNFGDFLFAKMFQNHLSKLVGAENVFWYQSRFAFSDFYSRHLNNNKKYKLSDIDAFVYMSGGYFLGDDHGLVDYIYRYLRYFHIGLLCVLKRIPYGIFGLEVGPTSSKWLHAVESIIFKNAKSISVRNIESLNYIKLTFGGGNFNIPLHCTADSVFALERSLFDDKRLPLDIEKCRGKKLFFHINPSIEANNNIVDKIVPVLNTFIKNHNEYTIIVSPDQYNTNIKNVLDYIKLKICTPNVIGYSYDDPLELCKVIDSCDFVITHKLHVGIVASHLGKSVVSFSGHTSKIERLYKQLNIVERTIPMSSMTYNKGIEMLEKFHDKPIKVSDNIKELAKINFKLLTSFIEHRFD